jgi:hypothetical protein
MMEAMIKHIAIENCKTIRLFPNQLRLDSVVLLYNTSVGLNLANTKEGYNPANKIFISSSIIK